MSKLKFKLFLPAALLFFAPFFVQADCTQNTDLAVVVRDPAGSFIANATVQIYKQELDANGQPKPTTRFASATTDANLGVAHLSWHNSEPYDNYALKVQTINKDGAAFWFYNLNYNCGASYNLTETLSGLTLVLHDENGSLLTNTGFNIYSQLYDSANHPLAQKKEQLVSANSGSSGQTKIYLPQGSVRSLDNTISDDYDLEISRNNFKFNLYNIHVTDGQMTSVNYYLSALSVRLQDITGALFPSGTNVEVFQQEVDANNNPLVGVKTGQFTLGAQGTGQMEIPADLYVLGVKGQNNQYQYFWNIDVLDGRLNEYDLTSSQNWIPTGNGCPNNSRLTISLRSYSGNLGIGLKYALYEQGTDANGLPSAGKSVTSGTIDSSGQAIVNFAPDPRKIYALKVWDRRADAGEFWFYNAVRFVCGYDRAITEYVPALKIILRDEAGNLKKNYNFSLYAQEYDADNNPFFQSSDLIATLQSGSAGMVTVYVAPYNPYRSGQTGFYALSAKDGSGNTVTAYNIKISADADSTFNYTFNGLSGQLTDASKKPLTNKEVQLYEQISGEGGYSLGRQLAKVNTDNSGRFHFEYSGGIYALSVTDDFNQANIFWNAQVSGTAQNAQKLVTNLTRFSLSDTEGGILPNNASLNLYSLTSSDGKTYYRDKQIGSIALGAGRSAIKALAAGPYLVTYNGTNNREFGVAFYAKNGLVQEVKVVVNTKYLTANTQSFTLSSVGVYTSPTVTTTSTITPAPTISNRLAGRILLQVQDKGQAWYVNPLDKKRYYMGRPADAFNLMRRFGLGISNANFANLQKTANRSLAGRILIKTEDSGRAYYYDPLNLQLYYLGRPDDAYNIIRSRGLGITNTDIAQIKIGL